MSCVFGFCLVGVYGTSRAGVIPVHWTWQVNMPLISGGKKIKYLPTQAMSCGLSKGGQMLAAAVLREMAGGGGGGEGVQRQVLGRLSPFFGV